MKRRKSSFWNTFFEKYGGLLILLVGVALIANGFVLQHKGIESVRYVDRNQKSQEAPPEMSIVIGGVIVGSFLYLYFMTRYTQRKKKKDTQVVRLRRSNGAATARKPTRKRDHKLRKLPVEEMKINKE